MGSKQGLKRNYKVEAKYGAFYTGGSVQWSAKGNFLFCQHGSSVKTLSVEDGKVERCFDLGEEEEVTAFAVSTDDQILVVGGRSGLLRHYDLENTKLERTWKSFHVGSIACMAFDTTSTLLASGGCDSIIKVWDVVRQYCTHHLRGAQGVFSIVKFHPVASTAQLFGAADDYRIHVWDLRKSTLVGSLSGHFSVITDLAFIDDGGQLLSSSRDKVVILWDTRELKTLKTIPVYESIESMVLLNSREISSVVIKNTKGPHFVTVGEKGRLRLWDVGTASCIQEQDLGPAPEGPMSQLLYCAEKKALLAVSFDHNITIHSPEGFVTRKQFVGFNDEVLDLRLLGPNESFLAVATNSPQVRLFELATFNCHLLSGHSDLVIAMDVFRSDPTLLATASKDNSVKVWRLHDDGHPECLFTGKGHTAAIGSVACSFLSASFLVTGGQDRTLKLWEVPPRPRLVTLVDPCAGVPLQTRATQLAHEKDINSVAVSPNDQLIATGSQDKLAKLWSATDLSLLGSFRGHRRGIWCVQFSAVDKVLATSSADTTIKLWSLTDFTCAKTFEGHECSVLKVLFLSQGMQLLSSGADGNLKLWNISDNECVKTLDEHQDKAWALTTNLDETLVVTGAADSAIIVWKDCTTEEEKETFEKQESLVLQEQELSNLMKEKKWSKALHIALTLEYPFKALTIIKEILLEKDSQQELKKALEPLREDQMDTLLRFACTWNTNSKHSAAAQAVLFIALNTYSPDALLKMPNARSNLEGFLPYTERHFQRMNRLNQQALFLEYLWSNMKIADIDMNMTSEESRE
ncbi:transducin beta-like protein 3 [Ornithodoros turicata]|uniref:transducin beta-like protein 3 n=1 Tax=Ornithodoros turicata TaxID=34597 RepID=UPI00313990CB